MIVINTTQIIFDPVKEYKQCLSFEERKTDDYKLVSESTTAKVYQKQEINWLIPKEETEDDNND